MAYFSSGSSLLSKTGFCRLVDYKWPNPITKKIDRKRSSHDLTAVASAVEELTASVGEVRRKSATRRWRYAPRQTTS
jgi:hypothetical protein